MKPVSFLALASTILSLSSRVQAIPAAAGDLILGFRATEAPGADTNLEVNLGPASAFYSAAAGSTAVLTRLSVQDLIDTYGSNWNTRADLSWGIIGTTGTSSTTGTPPAPARTIWASAPQLTPGTASTPWTRASASGLQNASGAIATMYGSSSLGSIGNFPATSNSAFASKVNASNAGSWSVQEDLVAGQSFRRFTPTVRQSGNTFPVTGSAYDGTGYSVLDLYDIRPGSGDATLLGGVGLNSAGKLVFSTDITKFAPPSGPVSLGIPTITLNNGGSITVVLAGVPSGNFILQRSTQLTTGSWSDLFTQAPAGGVLTFTDANPPQPRGFYRIKPAN